MLRSLWILGVYVAFIVLGARAPFVLTLGYVWVDTFQPQAVSYLILNQLPVAMIMGALAVGGYLLLDRRAPPRVSVITILQLMMATWITLTSTWAFTPEAAWSKWDWAFKTVMFSAFIPFVIRSRVQIEAFLQVYMFSLAANLIPFGVKMIISGGGYGKDLGLGEGNTGLGEGATLATVSIMTIPIYLYSFRHSVLAPKLAGVRVVYIMLSVLAGLTAVGTFERTGLVGLVTLGLAALIRSRRKLPVLCVGVVAAAVLAYSASSAWDARISTIGDVSEGSTLGRLLVWRWTLDFVQSHPLGGGFVAYLVDHIVYPDGTERFGIAFHSIYFEVLGEHGWPGLLIFLSLAIFSLLALQRTIRRTRPHPELLWCRDLASTLQICLVILLVCGSFIGIAFQPMLYYMFAISVSMSEYARRALDELAVSTRGTGSSGVHSMPWRANAAAASLLSQAGRRRDGWRRPQARPVE